MITNNTLFKCNILILTRKNTHQKYGDGNTVSKYVEPAKQLCVHSIADVGRPNI